MAMPIIAQPPETARIAPQDGSPSHRDGPQRRELRKRGLLIAPVVLTIGCFLALPMAIILTYSFLVPATYGGVRWEFSLEAYRQFLFDRDFIDETLIFNSAYLEIFSRSLVLAIFSMVACLLIGFPTAYFIATRPGATRTYWVFLITLPFWTNLLIRTYCVLLILREEGLINNTLIWLGVLDKPIIMMYTNFSMGMGLVYSYLPFMVLPLYANLEKLDFRLIEAAHDLYATRWRVLRWVILPHARPGITAGCLLVFIPSLGTFLAPDLLGGGKRLMIGNLIQLQFGSSRNWPFGAASAVILLVAIMMVLILYARHAARHGESRG
ncbi:ABC transporter permease [Hypericibacter terrae]|uniref:ABC transporter permease n=1 Tax=Hypericibacter terrae TaxID=2602015 RepID=A0A5J6MGA2_9PROT|nr:ABC transporter permease [Hypericibacter terrae]QEX16524.1 ABC transporter permease [Hypericibacter terrae]